MRLLITGICGFVGSTLARALRETTPDLEIAGLDNFIRPGSASNVEALKGLGVKLHHGDVRAASDFETLGPADWVIDCAANPSVLAGVDGRTSSRQLVEHNLGGTVNLLEFCKQHHAGFILLSTSRVYSIPPLAGLPVTVRAGAFALDTAAPLPTGVSAAGVSEAFSTAAPVSLYGATKLASEALALEYGATFDLPVFINRCGVLAGAGQFGRPDQGIFAYWIHSWACRRPLKYIGFDGAGHQVRDCLHPADLAPLLLAQMRAGTPPRARADDDGTIAARQEPGPPGTPAMHQNGGPASRPAAATGVATYGSLASDRILNLSGGAASARSLRQLSDWCAERFGPHPVTSDPRPRPFDMPWMVLDSGRAASVWGWQPARSTDEILEEIARHAEAFPDWLDLSAPL